MWGRSGRVGVGWSGGGWWVVGGGGADNVCMESLCRLTMTMQLIQCGRTPGSQTPGVPATPEPSMTKNSSPSRAPKTGAQLQTTWRSAKNGKKRPKKPSSPPNPGKAYPSQLRTGRSTDSGDKLNLRHLHCRENPRAA